MVLIKQGWWWMPNRWGVHGRVVKIIDFKPLAPKLTTRTLDSFIRQNYPASLRKVGGSTRAPVPAWNNACRGTWGLRPAVKLESRHITFTVLVWHKTQKMHANIIIDINTLLNIYSLSLNQLLKFFIFTACNMYHYNIKCILMSQSENADLYIEEWEQKWSKCI